MKDIIEVFNNTDDFLTRKDNEIITKGYVKIISRDTLGNARVDYNAVGEPIGTSGCEKIYIGVSDGTLMSHVKADISFISAAKGIYNERWFVSSVYLMHANKKRKRIDVHPDCRLYVPYGSDIGYCLMNHNDSLILEVANEPRKMYRNNIYEINYDTIFDYKMYGRKVRLQDYSVTTRQTNVYDVNEPVRFNTRIEEDMEKLRLSFYRQGE